MLPNKYAMDLKEANIEHKNVSLCIFIFKNFMNCDIYVKDALFVTFEQGLRTETK